MTFRTALRLGTALAALALAACADRPPPKPVGQAASQPFTPDQDARHALFGDLHLHTTFSLDAYAVGTRTTPEQAYAFARGEPVTVLGQTVRRGFPLDFMAVTDHSNFLGQLNQLDDPDSALSKTQFAKDFRAHPERGFEGIAAVRDKVPEMNAPGVSENTWRRLVSAANAYYQPGRFTTFIAFEWSATGTGRQGLHRNIIFSGGRAPDMPFSSTTSRRPEDLWTYMEAMRAQGLESLAIPHNADASGGLMWQYVDSDGNPIDATYAKRRQVNEPLTEIYQTKGQSETIPYLSAADEFADFEVMNQLLGGGFNEPHGSYAREALGRGLEIEAKTGVNPYRLGFVGGTDIHNGLTTSSEDAYAGGEAGIDPKASLPDKQVAQDRLHPGPGVPRHGIFGDTTIFGSGGLTGVWAETNTREAIYAALRRRETFATSGTRMRVRLFGGWSFGQGMIKRPDWVHEAYASGVPMGGDMPARPSGARAPSFLVWAQRDPEGANLDRVQIVKVWLEDGAYKEKVFDVALSGGRSPGTKVGNTVDIEKATYKNSIGAPDLSAQWTDPEFRPNRSAVYYARAIEIPTPRWSTILAAKRGLTRPDHAPATLQERAWTSPIWYTPSSVSAG